MHGTFADLLPPVHPFCTTWDVRYAKLNKQHRPGTKVKHGTTGASAQLGLSGGASPYRSCRTAPAVTRYLFCSCRFARSKRTGEQHIEIVQSIAIKDEQCPQLDFIRLRSTSMAGSQHRIIMLSPWDMPANFIVANEIQDFMWMRLLARVLHALPYTHSVTHSATTASTTATLTILPGLFSSPQHSLR